MKPRLKYIPRNCPNCGNSARPLKCRKCGFRRADLSKLHSQAVAMIDDQGNVIEIVLVNHHRLLIHALYEYRYAVPFAMCSGTKFDEGGATVLLKNCLEILEEMGEEE